MSRIEIGNHVQVYLNAKTWGSEGWFEGVVVRIDPYTSHRSFFWVELDEEAQAVIGRHSRLISVMNPKNIRKI